MPELQIATPEFRNTRSQWFLPGESIARPPREQSRYRAEFYGARKIDTEEEMNVPETITHSPEHMEAGGERNGQPTQRGPMQRRNSTKSMVTGSPLDDTGLANTSEPPAGKRQRQTQPRRDMARARSPRREHSGHGGIARPQESLGPLGVETRQRRQSVHPEGQTEQDKPTGTVSTNGVLNLLNYQSYRCALTGRPLTPREAALDHIIPVRFGGEHRIDNAQVLHKEVNRAKGSLTNEQFVALCHEVVAWSGPKKRKESQ